MKMTPLAVPGRWRTSTRPATVTRLPDAISASASGGKQRQVVLIAHPVEPAHRPKRHAPVKAQRSKGVGVGEPLQDGGAEPRAQPEIADGIIARAAMADEDLHIRFAYAEDLAKAQAHGVGRADIGRHGRVAAVNGEPLLP
jgi:hypothetical protein